ncbi:MAG: SDR family NAD(P)-dependent oxidoreductase [Gammaproteobacteria bacterium]|nr:SDR family NAD(P)-dependent oxidoreductase [Gammaproteobacteria bacterium]
MDLATKTIVVTGANGALGRAVVAKAVALGARVIALDLVFEKDPPPANVTRIALDLTDAAATRRCVERLDRFQGLFNIAGGFAMGPTGYEVSANDWDTMFKINVTTMHNAVRAATPVLLAQGRGVIVNVGALSAREGQANMSAYCAAKSVVMRLTESLAKELRPKGINVNAVLPSIIDTPQNRRDMPNADFSKWVSPEALANVICFLGSDAASAVHGALVPVVGLS